MKRNGEKRRDLAASSLSDPRYRQRVVQPRKGKRSYTRKGKKDVR